MPKFRAAAILDTKNSVIRKQFTSPWQNNNFLKREKYNLTRSTTDRHKTTVDIDTSTSATTSSVLYKLLPVRQALFSECSVINVDNAVKRQ